MDHVEDEGRQQAAASGCGRHERRCRRCERRRPYLRARACCLSALRRSIGSAVGVLRVEPEDKADEQCARTFLFEHYSLVAPLRVCQLVVAANRVSETKFNTPTDYAELEDKRVAKLKRKAAVECGDGPLAKRAMTGCCRVGTS